MAERETGSRSLLPGAVLASGFAAAFLLRLLPYLASGVPYHTDSLSLIADINNLWAHSPVPLAPGHGFDSYNVYWPGSIAFAAAASALTGVPPFYLAPVLFPFVGATAVLTFYLLLRELGLGGLTSAVAAALLGVAGGSAVISAGVTKEGFAFPLMFLTLALFVRGRRSRPALALSLVAFAAVLVSHHLTALVTVMGAVYVVVAEGLTGVDRGKVLGGRALVAVGFAAALAGYFAFYSYAGMALNLGFGEYASAVAYQVLVLFPVAVGFWVSRRPLSYAGWLLGTVYLALILGLVAALRYTVFLTAPIVTLPLVALGLPYLATGGLAVAGVFASSRSRDAGLAFLAVSAAGFMGLEGFVVFGTPGLLAVAYRMVDFLYAPVAALAAAALVKVARSGSLAKWAGVVLAVGLVVGSAYVVPYTAFYSSSVGGSQRVYSSADYAFARWADASVPGGVQVSGDIRAASLLGYYGVPVDIQSGLQYAEGASPLLGCFAYSSLMAQVGFVAIDYGFTLTPAQIAALSGEGVSVVYSDGSNALICAV